MTYALRTVDVFTERAFFGNQLAVVLRADDMASDTMQAIAKEMNLSETTFVAKAAEPSHAARVRIFTPTMELPFAGHPTIGTAWVLWNEGVLPDDTDELILEEAIGPITVRIEGGGAAATFWMTQPSVSFGEVIPERTRVALALGLTESDLLSTVPLQVASTGLPFLFVPLRDANAVDAAISNEQRLRDALGQREPVSFFLFAPVGSNRLYSRMFGPHSVGIPEDPATGSGSGPLGAFAVKYGLVPRAQSVRIVSEQGTKMGRQSFVHIRLAYASGAQDPTRIEVGGSVVPVLSGQLSCSI